MRIKEVEVEGGDTLVYRYSAPRKLERYLFSDSFYVKYDTSIEDVPRSIQYIPGVAGLVTLCWAKNTDIHVEELDSSFMRSMMKVRGVLNDFYPQIGFQGDIVCEEVDNSFENKGLGMLFSGGVDSTALYIRHRGLKPTLFSIIGGMTPAENHAFIDLFKRTYSEFTEREGVDINYIESDIRDVLNEALLWSENRRHLDYPWWEAVNQGLVHVCLCAPQTVEEIGELQIASTDYRSSLDRTAYGTHPYIEGKIRWGNISVKHEYLGHNRQKEIRNHIKRFIEEEGIHPTLQVCYYNPLISDEFNCGCCEKCSRTIIGLLAAGIDPEKCGLEVRDGLYRQIKEDAIPQAYVHKNLFVWTRIQEQIDLEDNEFYHNSEDFLRWLKDADLETISRKGKGLDLEELLLPIQARLPRRLQSYVLKTYYRWKYSS